MVAAKTKSAFGPRESSAPRIVIIENKKVGPGMPILIIAEAGVNHEGRMDLAKRLIDEAAKAGADMVKFQTFSADKIVVKKAEMAEYQKENLQSSQSQYDLLKGLEINRDMHKTLFEFCKRDHIIFQSTAHSNAWAINLLEDVGVSSHKIGSGDLTNIPHIINTAKTMKPAFLSTGMATMDEVREAVLAFQSTGNKDLVLFHCTTNYPCPFGEVNLKAMHALDAFGCPTGYSDHTMGILVPLLAVHQGAMVIEKHFSLDRNMPGAKSPDHASSLEPPELALMVKGIRHLEKNTYATFEEAAAGLQKIGVDFSQEYAKDGLKKTVDVILGDGIKRPNASELVMKKQVRKSIIAIKPIRKGERFTEENVDILRPEGGLHPREWFRLLEKGRASRDIKPEEHVTKDAVGYA